MRVVVVGGGILGTMHAWLAVQAGAEVVHLEADAGPRAASVRNFGLVWVSGRAAGDELAAALRARALWEAIGAAAPGVGFRPHGSLTVALDEAEWAVLRTAVDLPDAPRRGWRLLTSTEATTYNPGVAGPSVRGALLCEHDAIVEPGRVLGALRDALVASRRYTFLPAHEVVAVRGGEAVDDRGRHHGGDLVVVCPGARHGGLCAELLAGAPLGRCRLQMMETEPLGIALTTSIADADSLRYYPAFASLALDDLPPQPAGAAAARMQLLLVQRLDGRLTIGDTHAYDEPFPVGVDEAPYDHLVARAEAVLGRPLPRTARRWAGVYSQPLDGSLCVRLEPEPGLVVVTGPGGRGMTLAPALAETTLAAAGLVLP